MLREWTVKPATKRGYIVLQCPNCKLRVWVHKVSWIRASKYPSRSCIGCFSTFRVPGLKAKP